ncbi:MAG: phytoene desaturase family protein [Candidatus Eremiobacteraeota bacterium]|nr:phytoene desaturase family protein [Candidatus Eremiobacteraeota bacterium]
MSQRKRVVVVGAGIAGLSAAARLASAGYDTVVIEKQSGPGGRAAQATWDGFTFDLGPTLLFMLDVFRDAFASWGGDFDRDVPTMRMRPNYRLNFASGQQLDVSPVLSETIASLEQLKPGSSQGLLGYLAGGARAYELSMREFVGKPIRSFTQFLTVRKIKALIDAGAFRKLAPAARRAFGSQEIANAFSLQSMYLGMSPFASPEMYRLLLYTELGQGIFFPIGGIGALGRALETAARRNGADIRYNVEVDGVEFDGGAARSLRAGRDRIEADCVLFTADLPYVYDRLLKEPHHRSTRMRLTPSALLIYAALDRGYDDLLHHEFLMPQNLRDTCDDIFDRKRLPEDMAIYLAAPAKSDPSFAPPGGEALYVLVPIPNLLGSIDWERDTEEITQSVLERIERRRLPGLRSRIRFYKTRTPRDFATDLNLAHGSAFGLSHDLLQIGPLRPANRHAKYRNVYFAGASTRPATGLPLVTMSAMQTADRIMEEVPLHA